MNGDFYSTESVVAFRSPPRLQGGRLPSVMLTLPWYKSVNPVTAFCVAALLRPGLRLALAYGDAFIAHARNSLAERFLKSDCEWQLMLDDDMIVPIGDPKWFCATVRRQLPEPFASFHALDRLLSHGKTLVGGLYVGRNPDREPMFDEGLGKAARFKTAGLAPADVIKPVRWTGTGCLLVHRSVYEDISKKYPALAPDSRGRGHWYSSSEHQLRQTVADAVKYSRDQRQLSGEHAYELTCRLERGLAAANTNSTLGMGEDVQFCLRAAEAGHTPYVDLGLICGHVGDSVYLP